MEPYREKLLPSSDRHAHQPSVSTVTPEHRNPFRSAIPARVRTILRLLVLVISLSVTASLSFGIWLRNATRGQQWLNEFGYRFEIWPKQFELDPTTVFLIAAALSVLFNMVALLTRCIGSQRRNTPLHMIATTAGLGIGIVAWLAALIYSKTWNHTASQHNWWDLWTWSCHNPAYYLTYGNTGISFSTVCGLLKYTFWAGVIALALELINLILFWVNRFSDKGKGKAKAESFELKSLMGGFRYRKMGPEAEPLH